MSSTIPERHLIPPFLVFFIISSMQIGVGVLGFPRYVAEDVTYEAWIAVVLSGICMSVTIWLTFSILKQGNGDIISIHREIFGKWIGNFLSFLLLVYFFALGLVVARTYIEVIQLWVFSQLPTWMMALNLCLLVLFLVTKGFRAVVGFCFFGTLITLVSLLSFLAPLEFAHYRNLQPFFDHGAMDYLRSIKTMTLSFLGVKLAFIYYPFIKKPEAGLKWALAGNGLSILIYTYIAVITTLFYSQGQLQSTIWPTITIWQIIELPFVERFESTGVALWMLVILPNVGLAFWAASRGMRLLFSWDQRKTLLGLLGLLLLLSSLFQTRQAIDTLNTVVSETGFYYVYVYIPLLWIAQKIVTGTRRKKS
ncbi:GerAB/ArcD/ProY family transporter [Alteribacillus sp. HJP-4]|uniref:GerAB/ArcD/ProY family transporter n=1 Tax=Alteribacillus sp. HJP-4 TaxID=2775394 RepID=UPI0035CD3382